MAGRKLAGQGAFRQAMVAYSAAGPRQTLPPNVVT
jgi:hypothetical protein